MPIERISADDAFARLKAHRESLWPDGRKRGERLEGIAQVVVHPGFTFTRDTAVLTIGSCFARNIESHMRGLGFDLPMLTVTVPREERLSETANDILNKYSVHSIENEIRWAFEGTDIPLDKLLLETEDGLWHDPQLAPNLIPASFERVKERREEVMTATRQMARCGLVIITLGLAESWFDLETGLYLNGSLPPAALRRYPGRFALDVLSYAEILESLERIHALIRKHGSPDIRLLITTSPVPFKATFSGQDALVANSYSKSVQRAACREFSASRPDVDYFPSYEVVTLTERKTAYEVDNIHVRPAVVRRIMDTVIDAYCPDITIEQPVNVSSGKTVEAQQALGDKLYRARNYGAAADAYANLITRFGAAMSEEDRGRTLTNQGVALIRGRQTEKAVEVLIRALAHTPGEATLHYKLGLGFSKLGRQTQSLEYLRNALRIDSSVPDHSWRYGVELEASGHPKKARHHFQRALELDPNHAAAAAALAALAESADAAKKEDAALDIHKARERRANRREKLKQKAEAEGA